jgi:hypothetical protein
MTGENSALVLLTGKEKKSCNSSTTETKLLFFVWLGKLPLAGSDFLALYQ